MLLIVTNDPDMGLSCPHPPIQFQDQSQYVSIGHIGPNCKYIWTATDDTSEHLLLPLLTNY